MNDNGGPAFPIFDSEGPNFTIEHYPGMSKREVFAKAAMQSILAANVLNENEPSCIVFMSDHGLCWNCTRTPTRAAAMAVEVADALLAELKKEGAA